MHATAKKKDDVTGNEKGKEGGVKLSSTVLNQLLRSSGGRRGADGGTGDEVCEESAGL